MKLYETRIWVGGIANYKDANYKDPLIKSTAFYNSFDLAKGKIKEKADRIINGSDCFPLDSAVVLEHDTEKFLSGRSYPKTVWSYKKDEEGNFKELVPPNYPIWIYHQYTMRSKI